MTKSILASLKVLTMCMILLMASRADSATIQVTANLTGVNNWHATDEYVLNGFIYVLDGAVLNIDPGTVIRGKAGTGLSSAALFITRGAKIFANGTRENPIIFTSESDDLLDPNDIPLYARNLWGGVVIYGKSVLNTASDVAGNAASPKFDLFEGLPDTVVSGQHINAYGGNDDNDNSGVMRYCSIRYSSTVILPNKEINALSLCAVGRGTTIDHIECFGAGDDSVEFFGGTVNTKYMMSVFSDDDNFDIDQGYRGKNQFWFAIAAPDRKDTGGEWNGEPNGIAVNAAPIGNFEIYNATYIGAGPNSTGNRAFISREYAAPRVLNSIFTEYNIGGNIDDRSALHFTNGIATFSDNIFWNFASNGVPQSYWQNANAEWVMTNAANRNQFVNPVLRGISRTNVPANLLDPRPQWGSPALTSLRTAPNDGFYTPVAYKGAFNDADLWADGWTFASQVGLLSADSPIQVTANLSTDATWRSGHEYVLNGFIYVLTNAVLTIEPGTVVRGKAGTGLSSAALFITQGAKIYANGTRAKPIIFTSEADDLFDPNDIPLYTRNLWGGVVIYGRSILNTASDVAGNAASPKYDLFEGLPDTVINGQHINAYGGGDDNDNSGVMRYCSIRYSSTVILPNKEINALSLCAVGRGTTIENIECFGAGDDSVEFFGGTVNTKYMVSIFSDDDNFDIDQGYRGKNQFWFAIAAPDRKDTGGEWNGEPNGIAVNASPIGNFEIYNATYIGGGTNTTGNRAFISREYAAPKIFNSIFTEYNIGANIDDRSGLHFTNGLAKFQNNILWNFASNGIPQPYGQNANALGVINNPANSNLLVDPMLTGISRTNVPAARLDPRPRAGSPALNSPLTAPCDGFYTPVSYRGAFDARDLWIGDWTFASQVGLVPHRPFLGENTIQVTSNLTGTNNWYRTNQYVLNGFIYVLQGGVLNIEPGTVIRGKAGTGLSSAALFITRGAKINANGTAHSPIIFTSETDDLDDPSDIPLYTRNLWGGVVIYGQSVLNTASDVAGNAASPKFDLFEGLPDTVISGQHINAYGGNDDNDNSGVMRYCSIRYSSTVILPNKEINALSLCAVGRGTTIENIECFGAGDDSVEFFGGTVNTKYMASIFSDDDNFDIDQGYRGKNQFWFAIAAPDRKDTGGEWNGEPNGIAVNASPIGNFEIYNATYIGAGTNATGNRAFISREYAAPKIFNAIFTEYNIGANIDDRSGLHFTNGLAKFQNNILWNFASNGVPQSYAQNANALWVLTNEANANMFMDPMLRSVSRTNDPVFQLDPRPREGSPALSSPRTAPNDGFYTPVAYKGAFNTVNWAGDWGFAAEACLISGAGAGNPLPPCLTTPVCVPTTIDIVKNGANVDVTFTSVPGVTYHLIGSSDITAPRSGWAPLGALTATGTTSTFSVAASGSQQFLVVYCQ